VAGEFLKDNRLERKYDLGVLELAMPFGWDTRNYRIDLSPTSSFPKYSRLMKDCLESETDKFCPDPPQKSPEPTTLEEIRR